MLTAITTVFATSIAASDVKDNTQRNDVISRYSCQWWRHAAAYMQTDTHYPMKT